MAKNRNHKKGNTSIWALLLILLLAFVGYGWWSGSFSDIATSNVAKSVKETVNGIDKKRDIIKETAKELEEVKGRGEKGKDTYKVGNKQEENRKNNQRNDNLKNNGLDIYKIKQSANSSGHGRMAIVLDDFGYGLNVIDKFNALPIPLTYSVLPHEQYSSTVANRGYQAGKQIMLHLPMESISHVTPEKTTILTSMSNATIQSVVASAIQSVPHAIGVNNHQGSKASADPRVVRAVAGVIQSHGMFFLDSRTIASSKIYSISRSMGIPTGQNELFLDNSNNIGDIKARLRQAAKIALTDGSVIVIGHDRPNTYIAIRDMYQELKAEGIEFVFVSTLL